VDAEEHLRELNFRVAIPLAVMACEVAANQYGVRQTALSNSRVAAVMKLAGKTFTERCFDELPLAVCGVSLRIDDPDAFAGVDALSAERNKIMHRGAVSSAFAAHDRPARAGLVDGWLAAADRAVRWIDRAPLAAATLPASGGTGLVSSPPLGPSPAASAENRVAQDAADRGEPGGDATMRP
jgi:hypothetical protein